MRSSRRRLSVGAFGAYSASAASGTSPRSGTFSSARHAMSRSPAASKEYVERKAGTLERRSSVRSIATSFDSSAAQASDGHALSSTGSSSEPTSPQLQSFVQSDHGRALRGIPPDDMQLTRLSARNASQDSLLLEAQQQSPDTYDPSLVCSPDMTVGTTASNVCLVFPSAGTFVTLETTTAETQYAANAGQNDGTLKDPNHALLACGGHGTREPLQQPSNDDLEAVYSPMDTDYELEEGDEEDMRNEPLPTPEQLILSQSWSTWPTPCHHLYSGSQFSGSQSNGTRSYTVTVTLKYVDMGVPELCGHFTIRGLTNELPKLTTYFDAQIIGTATNSFITNQWDATVDTDRTHWSFFPAFRQYRCRFDSSDFAYRLRLSDRHVFMRWKERFVVPNYRLNRINGASYDGFYYVCYDREEQSITGYYYHRDSDHYQCLKLKHVPQTSFSHFELA
ncbi:GID complex subunit 4, VID24 [Coemansia sp. RSA 986]|nr:GID complex subunit 4, VID24 [Coemansia sp. RSA 986]